MRLRLVPFACLFPAALAAQQADRHPYRPGIDVLDYDLTVDLPDTGSVIGGRAVLTVRRYAPVDTLVLDLLDLRVREVAVNGRAVTFAQDRANVRVPLPTARAGEDTLAVTVGYGGGVTDGLIVRRDSLGRWTYFGDNWPDRGRRWIPSVDHPSDKATVTWTVRAPGDRKVVANGVLVEALPVAGSTPARTVTRWRQDQPISTYLMVIAAAPLVEYPLGETACGQGDVTPCVPQWVYVAPEVRDFLPGPFREAGRIVSYFSGLVGDFPYEKLAHLQSSTRFGGMENATAIFYSDGGFRSRRMGVGVVAHETAHQWFGDAVTEREWSHLWLSEGFATYFAALWTERTQGDSAMRATMDQIRRTVVTNPVVAARPVIDTIETDLMALLNRNSYQKGGFILHMLRHMLGDPEFFRGIQRYYAKYKHGTALSDDLRQELEAASGTDLAWFFDQWLRKPGFPEITYSWSWSPQTRQVALEITQGTRFGFYRFPLWVALTTAGSPVHVRVPIEARRTNRVILPPTFATAPTELVPDPMVWLLATFEPAATTR